MAVLHVGHMTLEHDCCVDIASSQTGQIKMKSFGFSSGKTHLTILVAQVADMGKTYYKGKSLSRKIV